MNNLPRLYNVYADLIPDEAVSVMRGSPYGNPYRIGIDGTRGECIRLFEKNILPRLDLRPLRGKPLYCGCHPKACHGLSLIIAANC